MTQTAEGSQDAVEPNHLAILQAIAEHRAESNARWEAVDRRLDEHGRILQRLPVVEAGLAASAAITKQYADDQAFKRGMNARVRSATVWGSIVAVALGLWISVNHLFGSGPKLPPPGVGPQ